MQWVACFLSFGDAMSIDIRKSCFLLFIFNELDFFPFVSFFQINGLFCRFFFSLPLLCYTLTARFFLRGIKKSRISKRFTREKPVNTMVRLFRLRGMNTTGYLMLYLCNFFFSLLLYTQVPTFVAAGCPNQLSNTVTICKSGLWKPRENSFINRNFS